MRDLLISRRVVDSATDCWIYTGQLTNVGYGKLHWKGKWHHVHRVAFKLFKGPIPRGRIVCHHCDVRPCFNPDHLYAGTHKTNGEDKAVRLRAAAGEHNGNVRFAWVEVQEIRKRWRGGESQMSLSRRFAVRQSVIWGMVHDKTWRRPR